jgi:hypothetical protein
VTIYLCITTLYGLEAAFFKESKAKNWYKERWQSKYPGQNIGLPRFTKDGTVKTASGVLGQIKEMEVK